jgi:gamma-glutamyltranspeptidase/glutathione hydrolase
MAGVEAMQGKFGRLPFAGLLDPAVWYAENGIRISPVLGYFFKARGTFLSRTEEGRAFMGQSGSGTPKAGEVFVQPELARTLKAIREQGSRYMYTGKWAEDFVRIVQREGGKVTLEDMARYQPTWSEPIRSTVFGHMVYANGRPQKGAWSLFTGLNLAEALNLGRKGPYWTPRPLLRC